MLICTLEVASAKSCREKFVELLTKGNAEGPVKIHATQEIVGGPTTTNYFYQLETGHWMTEMIEPANQAWVLTYNDTMFTSNDKGETWQKLRELDSSANAENTNQNLLENAATTREEVCGSEEIDGVTYSTVEATYDHLQNFKTENRHKYWVDPDTGWIARAYYHIKATGFESKTTQLISKAPDLQLPKPE